MDFKYLTVHSSATQPRMQYDVAWLRQLHVGINKWSDIGYHELITPDGAWHPCRPLTRQGAHVKGFNAKNLGICLVGGVDKNGQTCNNYTAAQMETLRERITHYVSIYGIPRDNIKGHRDWFGDTNGDGVVNQYDWLKECPCFDVQSLLKEWMK